MPRRRATPAAQAATTSTGGAERLRAVAAAASRVRLSCMLQMIDHLRFVETEFLEKVLGQRLGSRQPKPIALERDRAPARCTASMRGRALMAAAPIRSGGRGVEAGERRRTCTSGFDRWAVPLVSFEWGWSVPDQRGAPNSSAFSMRWSDWAVWSVLES